MTTTKPSLKATKQAIAKPSKVEIVLNDKQLLGFAPIVSLANDLIQFEIEHEELKGLLSKKRQSMAHAFCQLMSESNADYVTAMAYKKHLFASVASAQGVTSEYVGKQVNPLINSCAKEGNYKNLAWLKSPNKSAVSMSKARAEFEALSDSDIKQKVQALAKAEDFTGASKYSKELERRAKVKALEIKRNESKALTSLKTDVKAFITSADTEQLAAFVYTMNNIDAVLKLANQSK